MAAVIETESDVIDERQERDKLATGDGEVTDREVGLRALTHGGVDKPDEDRTPPSAAGAMEEGKQHTTAEVMFGQIAQQAGANLDVARHMAIAMHQRGLLVDQANGDMTRLSATARGEAFKFTAPHPTEGTAPDNMSARIDEVYQHDGAERVIITMGEPDGRATRLVIERDASGKVTVTGSEISPGQPETDFALDKAEGQEPGDPDFDYHTLAARNAVENSTAALQAIQRHVS